MKKILLILMVILLNLSLVFATDGTPDVSLFATNVDDNSARLTVSAVDVGDENNGLSWVGIYEVGGDLEGERNCDSVNYEPCVYYVDVVFPAGQNQVSYVARAKDVTHTYSEESNIITFDLGPINNVNINVDISVTPIQVTITWNTNIDTSGLVRYGSVSGVYTGMEIDSVFGMFHSATITGLSDDALYYFVIEASDIGGNPVGVSDEYSFSISDLTSPGISNIREEDVFLTSAKIKWETNELADSKVSYGTISGVYSNEVSDVNFVTSHDTLLTGLQDGETYYYIIESSDVDGNTAVSSEMSFTTGRLIITFSEPDDGDEFYVGDIIEGELRVRNADVNDVEVDIEIELYDDTEDDELDTVEFEEKDVDAGETRSFDFEFKLPFDLDDGNDYILSAEVSVGGTTYKQEVDIDVDRKSNDVRIENMRVNVYSGKLDVVMDIVNHGGRDQDDVYVDVTVFGLGLCKSSDTFSLEDWDGNNRVFKKVIFELDDVESGVYTVEAALYYGGSHEYVTRDFEIKDVFSGGVKVIESGLESGFVEEEVDFDSFVMKNVTWGIVDFLLLVVVIYGFVWLLRNR